MSGELLTLEGIRHTYAEAADWQLRMPAFEVRPSEIVGILGPNGSGKSTLLRIAAGMLRPLAGRIALEGRDLSRMDRRWVARRLGYLPQDVESQFDLSVEDVVSMGRYAHMSGLGAFGARDTEAVAWSLRCTDTQALRRRRLSRLSGGERQRVFLASVLAQQPRVLLLDEPTRHLDIHHQVGFFLLLRRLAHEGMGVSVVTHDVNLAALYCDRLLLLNNGSALCEGSVGEVLREDVLAQVYGADVVMGSHPRTGRLVILPADRQASEGSR